MRPYSTSTWLRSQVAGSPGIPLVMHSVQQIIGVAGRKFTRPPNVTLHDDTWKTEEKKKYAF
jgi:hypothetical protein